MNHPYIPHILGPDSNNFWSLYCSLPPSVTTTLSPYCILWKSTDYRLQLNGVRNEGEFHPSVFFFEIMFHPSVTLEIMVFLVGKFLELCHFLKSLGRSFVEK